MTLFGSRTKNFWMLELLLCSLGTSRSSFTLAALAGDSGFLTHLIGTLSFYSGYSFFAAAARHFSEALRSLLLAVLNDGLLSAESIGS